MATDDDNYSKRELDTAFGEVRERLGNQDRTLANQTDILHRIEEQTRKTNGRVTLIEEWSKDEKDVVKALVVDSVDYKLNKAKIYSAIALVALLGGTIIGLSVLAVRNMVSTQVAEAFKSWEGTYNIKVVNNQ